MVEWPSATLCTVVIVDSQHRQVQCRSCCQVRLCGCVAVWLCGCVLRGCVAVHGVRRSEP